MTSEDDIIPIRITGTSVLAALLTALFGEQPDANTNKDRTKPNIILFFITAFPSLITIIFYFKTVQNFTRDKIDDFINRLRASVKPRHGG